MQSIRERKRMIDSNNANSDRHALHRAMATVWAMRIEANQAELERIRRAVYSSVKTVQTVETGTRLPDDVLIDIHNQFTFSNLPQANIVQQVVKKAKAKKAKAKRKKFTYPTKLSSLLRSVVPSAPHHIGLSRLPSLDKRSEYADIDRSIGRCTRVALQRKFPRAWRETLSLAFIARKLKPHLTLDARVAYVARRYLIERSGANIRQGRIVRIAKSNQELTLLAKLIITKNEAKAKQLRFETTIDGTRGAVWTEIRSILGDTLFTCLESCESVTDAVKMASETAGLHQATLWRKLATVRARIIRP